MGVTNTLVSIAVFLVQIGLLFGLFLLFRRIARSKRRLGSAGPITVNRDGVTTVPAFATFTGLRVLPACIALASSNLSPSIRFDEQGIAYRVILRRRAAYSTIAEVEIRTGPGTVNVCFAFHDTPFTFSANVGEEAVALKVLRLLPQSIPRGPTAHMLEQSAEV